MSYEHTPAGRKVLVSLVPVICPPEAAPLADRIVDHMALTLGASPAILRTGFSAGLLAYDLGALPMHRRRAHTLTGARAERYFASWEHGLTPMQVQLARGINQLMSLSCYEMPEMTAAVGYHPAGWIEEVTKKRLAVYRDDVKAQEVQVLAPDPLRPGVDVRTAKRRVGA